MSPFFTMSSIWPALLSRIESPEGQQLSFEVGRVAARRGGLVALAWETPGLRVYIDGIGWLPGRGRAFTTAERAHWRLWAVGGFGVWRADAALPREERSEIALRLAAPGLRPRSPVLHSPRVRPEIPTCQSQVPEPFIDLPELSLVRVEPPTVER